MADGLEIGTRAHLAFRLRYEVQYDRRWRVREAHLSLLSAPFQTLHLYTDGMGPWTTPTGDALADLAGCLDVDIEAPPSTNTVAIRRTGLKPGEARDLTVVYL